jgi:hypothetical protein
MLSATNSELIRNIYLPRAEKSVDPCQTVQWHFATNKEK